MSEISLQRIKTKNESMELNTKMAMRGRQQMSINKRAFLGSGVGERGGKKSLSYTVQSVRLSYLLIYSILCFSFSSSLSSPSLLFSKFDELGDLLRSGNSQTSFFPPFSPKCRQDIL